MIILVAAARQADEGRQPEALDPRGGRVLPQRGLVSTR